MKHNHTPILGIFLASGLLLAFAGCRSFAAPSRDTAIFTNLADAPNYSKSFAAAHDNAEKLCVASSAAKDTSLTPRARAAWLKVWKDLAFAEGQVTLELLQALAADPASTDVDANLFRAFGDLAPEKPFTK